MPKVPRRLGTGAVWLLWEGAGGMTAEPADAVDDFALLRGEVVPHHALLFHQLTGRVPRDFIRAGSPALALISQKFRAVLEHHRIGGWRTFPIQLHSGLGDVIGGYEGLVVTGRCGPIDWSRSEVAVLPPVSSSGDAVKGRRGMHPDLSKWDGTDIFLPQGRNAFVFVTDRVRRALVAARITNVSFSSPLEWEEILIPDD